MATGYGKLLYGFTIFYWCLASTMKRQKQHIAVTHLATDTVQHGVAAHCSHILH